MSVDTYLSLLELQPWSERPGALSEWAGVQVEARVGVSAERTLSGVAPPVKMDREVARKRLHEVIDADPAPNVAETPAEKEGKDKNRQGDRPDEDLTPLGADAFTVMVAEGEGTLWFACDTSGNGFTAHDRALFVQIGRAFAATNAQSFTWPPFDRPVFEDASGLQASVLQRFCGTLRRQPADRIIQFSSQDTPEALLQAILGDEGGQDVHRFPDLGSFSRESSQKRRLMGIVYPE